MTQPETPHGRGRLWIDPHSRITCPKCEHEFSLADGFARKSLEQMEEASVGALTEIQAQARAIEERRARQRAADAAKLREEQLRDVQETLAAQRRQHEEAIERMRAVERDGAAARESELRERLKAQSAELEQAYTERQKLAARANQLALQEAGFAERLETETVKRAGELARKERETLEAQIKSQGDRIEQFQATELQLRKERESLEAQRIQLELDVQRRLDEERQRVAAQARHAEAEKNRLREAELQKKIDDMHSQVEEMKRRAEQGSQQLQGEVLELLLEEQLASAFPLDSVEEVKKGARGGDAVHRVMTRSGQQAGLILWEAKRAQNWSPAWAKKLKDDMQSAGADVGVIVATSLPRGFDDQHFGPHEGIWVTTPTMALQVACLLRFAIEGAHKQRVITANRDEQAGALYDYLTSPQFAQKWRAVHDAFTAMQRELDTEKTTTMQRWARREKAIEQAVMTLVGVAGEIQGLAQQDLPQLELAGDTPKEPVGES